MRRALSPAPAALPLTALQQGMLAHQLRAPGSGVDVEQVVVTLEGAVDAEAMHRAWRRLVDHHALLRTAFAWDGLDAPEQRVMADVVLPFEPVDATTVADSEHDAHLARWLALDRRRGIDLAVPPLMRVTLVRRRRDAVLVWSFHHALLDGRCFPMLLREAFATYDALRDGRSAPPLPDRGGFGRFVTWVGARAHAASDAFWRETLAGVTMPTPIPVARTVARAHDPVQGDRETWLEAPVVSALARVATAHGVTLNTLVQAAWALVLARYAATDDVTFGVTRAGRRGSVDGADDMLGLFITTVPLRVRLRDDQPLGAWLRSVRASWDALRLHEHTPLPRIHAATAVPAGQPLFESIVMFERYELDTVMRREGGAWTARTVRLHEQNGFPLTLAAYADERLLLRLEFDGRRFDGDVVERMLAHCATALGAMAAAPQAPIGDLEIVPATERRQLLEEWAGPRRAPDDRSLAHLLAAQAEATPEAVAVEDEHRTLTFAALAGASTALARRLREAGVGAGVRVGVAAERSVELVIALVAVVRAGGCYVPVDPDYPADRVQFMLDDADVRVLLTTRAVTPGLPPVAATVILLDGAADARDDGPSLPWPAADDPAYMIYTSGSTGRPKGAVNAHRGIVNRLQWMQEEYRLTPRDVVLQKTPFSFDVSVWEFFWPLLAGARLVMARPGGHRDTQYLTEVITARGVTVCHFVPSMLRAFLADAASTRCRSLRDVMASGEALPPDLVAAFHAALPAARLHNLYGPTECAVDVSYWPCPRDVTALSVVPIGRPVANTRLYVLDARGRVCAIGVPGELHLAGVQVGLGYHNRPELTAEKFVPDPFAPADERTPRMYRTGDLARWRADGTVEYLGRLDFQVKIRGFRIELGEIEAALLAHPDVADTVVTAHETVGQDKRLVAYVVPRGQSPSVTDMRAFLLRTLPEHMVPALFMFLDALPLSSNGKVDRRALPAPEAARAAASRATVPPRTANERVLARIWSEVLRAEVVGVDDNFFELGGDSLLAIQVISRAAREGLALSLTEALLQPTVAAQARIARERAPVVPLAEGPVPAGTAVPLTPVQRWFAELDPADAHHWNQAVLFETPAGLEADRLQQALADVAAHHDAFRLRFARDDDGRWRQWYAAEAALAVEIMPLPGGDAIDVIAAACDRAQRLLQLDHGPLARAVIMSRDGAPGRVLLVVHHLVVDGVSWRVLREDLEAAYNQLGRGEPVSLAPAGSWRSWSEALAREATAPALLSEVAHWQRQLAPGTRALPVDRPGGANLEGAVDLAVARLTATETTALLQQVPAAYGTRINDALLAALGAALGHWLGDATVLVDLEGHGREALGPDVGRTVGWFTSVFPVRLACAASASARDILLAAKEQLRALPRHGVGFGILRYLTPDAGLAAGASADILFNYLGQVDQVVTGSSLFRFAAESAGPWRSSGARRRHELEVNAEVRAGALEVRFAYARTRYDPATIAPLAAAFEESLRAQIAHATSLGVGGHTPSDFPLAALDQASLDRLIGARRGVEDLYPLTPVQRMFLDTAGGTGDPGLQQYQFALEGDVDEAAMLASWQAVQRAHPALRTRFVDGANGPLQLVEQHVELPWAVVDPPAGSTAAARDLFVREWLAADLARGLDAREAPLMRVALLRVAPRRALLVWTQHHLILDRWSWPLALRQVGAQYAARRSGAEPVALAAPRLRDAVAAIIAPASSEAERYWRAETAGLGAVGRLLGRPIGDMTRAPEWRDETVALGTDETAVLVQEARRRGLSTNTVVLGAWALALARSARSHDVSLGLAVAGRALAVAEVDQVVGVLINNVPVRATLSTGTRATDWLAALQARQAELRGAEQVALETIQQWSGLPWGQRLFESLVVFQDAASEQGMAGWFGPSLAVVTPVTPTVTAYPLTVLVTGDAALSITLRADVRWVAAGLQSQLGAMLRAALSALAHVGDRTVGELLTILPEPLEVMEAGVAARAPLVAPRDALETVLAAQWAGVLGHETVGVTESFFALGGSSLAATQLVARARERFQLEVPVRAVFEAPTVESFARALVAREKKRGQVQRIAQLIVQVEGMSAEALRASAAQRPPDSPPAVSS